VAILAAALNDSERSLIGDVRRGSYSVSIRTPDMTEAERFAATLTELGLTVQTNYKRDRGGTPTLALVTLYDANDLKQLFDLVEGELEPERRKRLGDLVLARGPIPDEVLDFMWGACERRRLSDDEIAEELNELGIIAGMKGKRWTGKKVKQALADAGRASLPPVALAAGTATAG
jgi:hypothetical protein